MNNTFSQVHNQFHSSLHCLIFFRIGHYILRLRNLKPIISLDDGYTPPVKLTSTVPSKRFGSKAPKLSAAVALCPMPVYNVWHIRERK